MSSLLDIGPLTEQVEVRGVQLTIHGLSAANLFKLFSEFPNLQRALSQLSSETSVMLDLAPDLFAKIIAIVTGSPNDKAAENKAKELGAADQMTILSAVQRLSFPQGFVPFVEEMTRLMGTAPSNVSSTNSGGQFSAALQTDSPGMMRGISPPAN
jgi:hypothetical protein